jgi:hypothetical protein
MTMAGTARQPITHRVPRYRSGRISEHTEYGFMPSSAIGRELLTAYEGLNISDICTAVRFIDNTQNHCAHFVNHVLGVNASLTCGQLVGRAGPAANIRVHETFARCEFAGKFEDRPARPCLVFVVQRNRVDLSAQRMDNVPQKHILMLTRIRRFAPNHPLRAAWRTRSRGNGRWNAKSRKAMAADSSSIWTWPRREIPHELEPEHR